MKYLNLKSSVINQQDFVDVLVGSKLCQRPRNVAAKMNSDQEFVCDVYANPLPTIYWLKDSANLTTSDYVQVVNSRTLRILGLLQSDAGMYQCMADAGDLGSLQASAQLIVQSTGISQCAFFILLLAYFLIDSIWLKLLNGCIISIHVVIKISVCSFGL